MRCRRHWAGTAFMTKVYDQPKLRERCLLHKVAIPSFDFMEWCPTMDVEHALLTVDRSPVAVVTDKNSNTTRSTGAQTGGIAERLVCKEK